MNICARMRSRIFIFFCMWCVINSNILADGEEAEAAGFVVTKESRRTLVSTENGEILAARVGDGSSNYHLLHFFTMDPNSLFLPVLLHYDMVFYVHTGSGKLSWTEENELHTTDLRRGDVYRLKEGAVFFIQSNLETTERRKLRINAIFANSNTVSVSVSEPPTGPYSSIRDLVLGFDKKLLQAAFKVPEEEIDELFDGAKPPAIIHGVSKSQKNIDTKFIGSLLGSNLFQVNKKKGKGSVKLFNLFNEDKDFENRNGWSTTVTKKKLSVLKDTDIGLFMVNLTTGSMMGPHWNPLASEISVVLQGRGMVHVVCSSVSNDAGCKNMRFEVEEGDVFAVPRFHPMAHMAFNNETFVFMGFSTSSKNNHPQYLAGQASVLRTLSKEVLAMSFNVRNTMMDQLLASQQDSIILGCISCAEEELSILEEEREEAREREEERQRKEEEEEEEAKEREEEEAKRQEEEEEAEAKREEEERKRREEEEEAKREEQERKRQEEEETKAKRQEQEQKRHEEEEEGERQEEERKRWEEEEAQREEEVEERRRQEEAGREKEKRERREEAAERREAKEEKRRHEEEMARREEEERQRQEAEEEEERRQRKEGREGKHGRRWSEEEEAEAEEEERRKEQEEEREEGEREEE